MTEQERPLRVVLNTFQHDPGFRPAITVPVELVPTTTGGDEEVADALAGADAIVTIRFTAGMAAGADRLRLIQTGGAGTDQIDLTAIPAGATLCNVYEHENGIAEYVFMAMLALNRDLFAMDARLRRGEWADWARSGVHREIRERTLLVIGLGHIGVEVARLGQAFGMRVRGVTRTPGAARVAALGLDAVVGLDGLRHELATADFVVVAVPLLGETTGLIGAPELGAMQPDAFLVNVARGPVIDEAALYEALRDRRIGGAAIDVWYRYPAGPEPTLPATYPFQELPNVIMTPHISGRTEETFQRRWVAINENLRRLAAGEPLLNVVWPAP